MKINVKKITSVTLLTSLVLTNLSSPIMSAMTYAMESEKVVVNAEETEVMATEALTEEDNPEYLKLTTGVNLRSGPNISDAFNRGLGNIASSKGCATVFAFGACL